ncbi:MAG: hypothetical protein WCO66_01070 [Candidatus Absconditabacteria bacterium]
METKLMRFFQREIYKRYNAFLQEAIHYFPTNRSLQLAQSKDPDFNLLITLIFAARDKYFGHKEESMILCERIAGFSALYCNICDYFIYTNLDQEYVYKREFEQALIDYLKFEFIEEVWAKSIAYGSDMNTLISYIISTNRYINNEEIIVDCVRTIAAYTIQSTKDELITTYIKQVSLRTRRQVQNTVYYDAHEDTVQIYQKNTPKMPIIIIEVGKKKSKNKRKISEQKKLKALLERGQSFSISLSPVTTSVGVKRIVIKDSFESVIEFIEANIPQRATIVKNKGDVKISFSEKISKFQYKRD